MKEKTDRKIARKIIDIALYSVKNTVGLCFPLLVHEVKLPDSVRQEYSGGAEKSGSGESDGSVFSM